MFEQMSLVEWSLLVVSILLAISEYLPFSEKVKANGLFQGILNALKWIKEKFGKK